jgi:hypothetical protein
MRAIETTPAASLDTGKELGNLTVEARSEGQPGHSLERVSTKTGQKTALDARSGRPNRLSSRREDLQARKGGMDSSAYEEMTKNRKSRLPAA